MTPRAFFRRIAAPAALLLPLALTVVSCGDDDEPAGNAEVVVEVVHDFETVAAPGGGLTVLHEEPRTFTTDQGFEVTLTKAYLVLSAIEVHAAGGQDHGAPLRPAHSPTFPGIHAPMVERLLEHDLEPVAMGNFQVAQGQYHGMTVTLEPGGAGPARRTPAVGMVGETLYLEGTVTKGEFSGNILVSWDGSADVPVAFATGHDHGATATRRGGLTPAGSEGTLDLRAGTPTILRIGKSCAGWFDGIDFTTASGAAVATSVVAHVQASLHHHVGDVHGHE
jgi:hypothetical protein